MGKQSPRSDGLVRIVPGERFTPYALARKLGAMVILESSSFRRGRARYSVLMVREAFRVQQSEGRVSLVRDGKRYRIQSRGRDILDVLMYFAAQHPRLDQDLPYPAGGVGYLSYEFASYCDTIHLVRKDDPLRLPDAEFLFGHVFVVFDHFADVLYLLGLNYNEHAVDLETALDEVETQINDLNFNYLSGEDRSYHGVVEDEPAVREQFLRGVESVRQDIIRGNLLQGVLSRRMVVRSDLPALEAYRQLRSSNPSPYMFYLDFGRYQVFGSSPEMHLKAKAGVATLRPIAGTRRRGKNPTEDAALEAELLADEKERAEHLMLIDLARNDLGRTCKPGSVGVTEYMGIERYSHVMHIVSEVQGRLRNGMTGVDAVRATFPAGTVSGAPKIRAIETIDRLEPVPRRFYAGLVGYLEPGGNLDTCITIRSGLRINGAMILQAGAGVVYDSRPEREYEETGEKLMALAHALGVEVET